MKASELPQYYNAVDILERNLLLRQNKIALYSAARTLTFGEVAVEANQVGNGLRRLGVRFGDAVGILAPDSAEWVTAFFGTIKIGARAVCLNTLLQPQEYDYIFRDSRLRILIVHESLAPAIEEIRARHAALTQVVIIGQIQGFGDITFDDLVQAECTQLAMEPTHRDDFCSLHYTSGTTGQPKGMFHAHKDYALIAQNTGGDLLGITENDRAFSIAKLFFGYGLGNLVMPWYKGACVVLYDGSPRMARGVLETIDRFKPTILYSVPTAYIAKLTVKDMATRYDLSSLRLCISSGEALSKALWQQWKAVTGLEILDVNGSTETFLPFLANRPDALRPGSSGKPCSGYEARIVDDAGDDVPQGEIGDLLVKGDATVLSYLHHYEKSRQTFRGEWFFTGDKYYQDQDGFYWHTGRADDMFKVGGLWVSPVEVESMLLSHPAIKECALVGYTNQKGMVTPKAYICLHDDCQPSNDLQRALVAHCASTLAAYKCPRWIEFVDELPRTATGKIQRFKLRDEVTERGQQ